LFVPETNSVAGNGNSKTAINTLYMPHGRYPDNRIAPTA